jgi:hypothetical protein
VKENIVVLKRSRLVAVKQLTVVGLDPATQDMAIGNRFESKLSAGLFSARIKKRTYLNSISLKYTLVL